MEFKLSPFYIITTNLINSGFIDDILGSVGVA